MYHLLRLLSSRGGKLIHLIFDLTPTSPQSKILNIRAESYWIAWITEMSHCTADHRDKLCWPIKKTLKGWQGAPIFGNSNNMRIERYIDRCLLSQPHWYPRKMALRIELFLLRINHSYKPYNMNVIWQQMRSWSRLHAVPMIVSILSNHLPIEVKRWT